LQGQNLITERHCQLPIGSAGVLVGETPDAEAKALCRACPRRWLCAREAVESAGAEGLWAGVVIPEAGRARAFALGQLRSLAERNGYPVRETAKSA